MTKWRIPIPGSDAWWRRWAGLPAFACLVLAVKVLMIAAWGDPTPVGDQWYEEAGLFVSDLRGTLGWAGLLSRHYEHHLLPTRLLDLLLFHANQGIWNPLLQMSVNALLHTGVLVMLLVLLRPACGEGQWRWLLVFATGLCCLPYDQENTLNGFQSQIYFTLLFSIFFLHGIALRPPLSPAWWLALASGGLAWMTHGAGTGTLVAGALMQGLRLWHGERGYHNQLAALLLVVLAALALADLPPPVMVYAVDMSHGLPHTVAFSPRAHSLPEFVAALLQVTAWPALLLPLPVLMLPLVIFLWRQWRAPWLASRSDAFLFALGVWVLVTEAGIAFGRASAPLASRYTDFYAIGLLLDAFCLLRWIRRAGARHWFAWGWLVLTLIGLAGVSAREYASLRDISAPQSVETGRHVRAHLESGCVRCLAQTNFPQIPQVPTPDELRQMLDVPELRSVLPPPLVPEHQVVQAWWVNALLEHLAAIGRFMLAVGVLLAVRGLRRADAAYSAAGSAFAEKVSGDA